MNRALRMGRGFAGWSVRRLADQSAVAAMNRALRLCTNRNESELDKSDEG